MTQEGYYKYERWFLMADFLTHTIFAEEVLNRINDKKLKNEIEQRMKLYVLGAQGPDIFYYYNFLPWQKSKHVSRIATLIHNFKTGDFLKMGIKYALKTNSDKEKYNLLTYMLGFLCHFHLDKNIHPYVCYCTENKIYKTDGTLAKVSHQDIETTIDIIYSREKKGQKAHKIKLYKLFNSRCMTAVILEFYTNAFKKLFLIHVPGKVIRKSAEDMRKGFMVIYDPYGFKKAALKMLGISTPRPLYTMREDESVDWLNRGRRKWYHLDDKDETYTLSVDDIYEIALKECSNMINELSQRIDTRSELDDLFPNLSYITNKPINA